MSSRSSSSSSSSSSLSKPLPKGQYAPKRDTDLRSPCPLINCLANHGYISRDGRNVLPSELGAAMNEVGLSTALGAVFSQPIFLEHWTRKVQRPRTFFAKIWYFLRNPWAIILAPFGMRRPGQQDASGRKVLDLDQLGLPGVVEHDISLTRRDYNQENPDGRDTYDNITPQADLINDLLECPADKGKKAITIEDFAKLRRHRIEKQLEDNPGLYYGPMQHQIACTEIALVLDVFGDGKSVPYDYARAFFLEERLPRKEGWKKRSWWSLGFLELGGTVGKVKKLVGLNI